jgi:hypothetical protein
VRRTLTLAFVAAGGLVLAGAALQAPARDGGGPVEPLLSGTELLARRNGARRPAGVPGSERSTPVSNRFISNMLLALAGGLVLVVTQAFGPPVVAWIAFGVTGVGVLLLMIATALAPGRGNVQRTLDAVAGVLAVWTIVETLVFSGMLMVWLTFGAAAAIVAVGAAGLIAHELSTERVVHTLEDTRAADRHMEALA